MKIIRDND